MDRRTFLAGASTTVLGSQILAAAQGKRRVAVMGHTGRGNYGHGLDVVWQKIPAAVIVGVADPDEQGLERALRQFHPIPAPGMTSPCPRF